jgi:catechol 2,3-dioxygenase-like lactoylglutathione lyase family enzyme
VILRGAHHFSITVADIERARAFYGKILGLKEIERPDFGFPGAWYQAGSVQLHLIVPPPGVETGRPAPALTPVAGHIAFEIDDYQAMKAHLELAGVELLGLGARVGQMFVRDPDGNVVELIQPGGQLGGGPATSS